MSMSAAIQARVSEFMTVLEKTTADALAAQADGVKASAELALMMQRAATQQVVLGSYLEQRQQLTDLIDTTSGPMTVMLESQVADLDKRAITVMSKAGVPQKAAMAALEAFSHARHLDHNPINSLRIGHKNGAA